MKSKKLFSALLSISMLALSLSACGGASSSAPAPSSATPSTPSSAASPAAPTGILEKIQSKGKLVIGTEAQYAPFEFKNAKAEIVGCDIWLANQIATELGVKLEIVDMAFDGIIPAVQSGQVDLGIAGFTRTDERDKVIDFSDIYLYSKQVLVVKKEDVALYNSAATLKGLKVGAQKGTIQSILISTAFPESTLFELAKYPELALEVQNSNIAGLVVDESVGLGLVSANPALGIAAHEFSKEEANFGKAVVANEGQTELIALVNKVVDRVVTDGSFEKEYVAAQELAATLGVK